MFLKYPVFQLNLFQSPGPEPVLLRLLRRVVGGLDGSVPGGDLWREVRGAQEAPQEEDVQPEAEPAGM